MTPSQLQQDVVSLLKKADNVLVLPSSPIDGDCLGSSLALYLALKKMGKNLQHYALRFTWSSLSEKYLEIFNDITLVKEG